MSAKLAALALVRWNVGFETFCTRHRLNFNLVVEGGVKANNSHRQ